MANQVDDLKTNVDVEKFITSLDKVFQKKHSPEVFVNSIDVIKKHLDCIGDTEIPEIKNWEKADFNNDGNTDLLVLGYWGGYATYIAMDNGNNTFKLIALNYDPYHGCEFSSILKDKTNTLLVFNYLKAVPLKSGEPLYTQKEVIINDTLTYIFGDFIEFNKVPLVKDIDSITFKTGICFGSCPVFSIQIDKSGNAVYNAEEYNRKKGVFRTNIKSENLEEINNLFKYMDLKGLQANYSVSWTDYPTCYLTINFSDGSIKKIKDYGERGTFGLRKLYSLFFDLRNNQHWTKE